MEKNIPVGGYIHFYIKDKEAKRRIIPIELKDVFLEKFGADLLNTDENEVDEFLKNSKQK